MRGAYASEHISLGKCCSSFVSRQPYDLVQEIEGHSSRVAAMCVMLAEATGIVSPTLAYACGYFHDFGKFKMPNVILKQGRLSDMDKVQVRKHPDYGIEILTSEFSLELNAVIHDAVLYHHERFDGSGYPCGLCGNSIPAIARLVSVCDVVDALASDRCYRPRWSPARIAEYLHEEGGRMWGPLIGERVPHILPDLLRVMRGGRHA